MLDSRPGTDAVLSGVSLSVHPGDHMAICGRSGSGKTSLILSLLRMMDITAGQVILEGVDITAQYTAEEIRSRINVVPQDPFILPQTTVRFSLDASNISSDDEIMYALDRVGLGEFVRGPGDLDRKVEDLGLSSGQTQLLCFARAMVKRKTCNILVLDEATSRSVYHYEYA